MEFIWLIIVVLYLVFVAMSQSAKKRPQREAPRPWEFGQDDDDSLFEFPEVAEPGVELQVHPHRYDRMEMQQQKLRSVTRMGRRRIRRPVRAGAAAKDRTKKKEAAIFNREKWAQAVIMSELLRTPRAFRPYRVFGIRR